MPTVSSYFDRSFINETFLDEHGSTFCHWPSGCLRPENVFLSITFNRIYIEAQNGRQCVFLIKTSPDLWQGPPTLKLELDLTANFRLIWLTFWGHWAWVDARDLVLTKNNCSTCTYVRNWYCTMTYRLMTWLTQVKKWSWPEVKFQIDHFRSSSKSVDAPWRD